MYDYGVHNPDVTVFPAGIAMSSNTNVTTQADITYESHSNIHAHPYSAPIETVLSPRRRSDDPRGPAPMISLQELIQDMAERIVRLETEIRGLKGY